MCVAVGTHYGALDQGGMYGPSVGAGVEFTTVAEMWDDVAMLAAWGGDMARRPRQRASARRDVLCREVTTMVEARTNEPPFVPLSWVGYLA